MAGEGGLGERIAILETELKQTNKDLDDIKKKLDDLLALKDKGMGAFWLVSLLIGSGILGLIFTVVNLFKSHI